MNVIPSISLKTDNSISPDKPKKSILISDIKYGPSTMVGNELIIEGYSSLSEVKDTYQTLDNFFINIRDRRDNYNVICDNNTYVILFVIYCKSIFKEINVDNLYKVYKLYIYQEKLRAFLLHNRFRLYGLDGYNFPNQFCLRLNNPVPKEEFINIYNSCNSLGYFSNINQQSITYEFQMIKFLSGKYDTEFLYAFLNYTERYLLEAIVNEIIYYQISYCNTFLPYSYIENDSFVDILDRSNDPERVIFDIDIFNEQENTIHGYSTEELTNTLSAIYTTTGKLFNTEYLDMIKNREIEKVLSTNPNRVIDLIADRSPFGIEFNKLLLVYLVNGKNKESFIDSFKFKD